MSKDIESETTSASCRIRSQPPELGRGPVEVLFRTIEVEMTKELRLDAVPRSWETKPPGATAYESYIIRVGDDSITLSDTDTAKRLVGLLQQALKRMPELQPPEPRER